MINPLNNPSQYHQVCLTILWDWRLNGQVFYILFEQITHLLTDLTKSQENKILIITKLTANETRRKKLQTPDILVQIRDSKIE